MQPAQPQPPAQANPNDPFAQMAMDEMEDKFAKAL